MGNHDIHILSCEISGGWKSSAVYPFKKRVTNGCYPVPSTSSGVMEIADIWEFMVLYCFPDSNWSYRNSRTLFIGAVVEFVCRSIHQLFHCLQVVEYDDSVDGHHNFYISIICSDRPLDWLHLLNQGHAASGRWPCNANGWFWPVELVTISWMGGSKTGASTKLLSNWGNHIWLGHAGAINITEVFFPQIFARQQGISTNGGNKYRWRLLHDIDSASTANAASAWHYGCSRTLFYSRSQLILARNFCLLRTSWLWATACSIL